MKLILNEQEKYLVEIQQIKNIEAALEVIGFRGVLTVFDEKLKNYAAAVEAEFKINPDPELRKKLSEIYPNLADAIEHIKKTQSLLKAMSKIA